MQTRFYIPEDTPTLAYAQEYLLRRGMPIVSEGRYASHVLLGMAPKALPEGIPEDAVVMGGKLDALAGVRKIDFLKDTYFLAENAKITAHCALSELLPRLNSILPECPVLVIGWGRIGKCLAALLKNCGASVTVASRWETNRGLLHALGYQAMDTAALGSNLAGFRAILNTAPELVLDETADGFTRPDCVKLDLASVPGMVHAVSLRGLPGKDAPESAGRLMALTAIRLQGKEGTL